MTKLRKNPIKAEDIMTMINQRMSEQIKNSTLNAMKNIALKKKSGTNLQANANDQENEKSKEANEGEQEGTEQAAENEGDPEKLAQLLDIKAENQDDVQADEN